MHPLLLFALVFGGVSSAQMPTELGACQMQYGDAGFALDRAYARLTAEQQVKLDPVRQQLGSAIRFLHSTEGATGYKPLCSDEVLSTLTNVVWRAQAMAPPPLTMVEGKAEREALLKAAREFMR